MSGPGNGQAAVALAEHFASGHRERPECEADRSGRRRIRESSIVSPAKTAGLDAGARPTSSTVAQALHWFDRPKFWDEVRRVLRPGGVIAVWCYELQQVSPDIDAIINRFYRETVGPYWTPDRKLVEDGYRSGRVPVRRNSRRPSFAMTTEWTLEQQVGYLGTWSAVGRYREETGRRSGGAGAAGAGTAWPANESRQDLLAALGARGPSLKRAFRRRA